MSYNLTLSGHTDDPAAEAEFVKAARRLAAHLRKVRGLGLGSASLVSSEGNEDLLADRGTAEAPIKPEGPTLPEGWSSHPDGGYVDDQGNRVAARNAAGVITAGVDEGAAEADVVSISRADTPDLDSGGQT